MVQVTFSMDGAAAVTTMEQDKYHRQFKEGGPTVYVKNTFLDHGCDHIPTDMPVTRGSTAPPSVTCIANTIGARDTESTSCSSEDCTQSDDEFPTITPRSEIDMCEEHSVVIAGEQPPTPVALIHSSTYDPFENSDALIRSSTYDPFENSEWLPTVPEWGQISSLLPENGNTGMMPMMIVDGYLPCCTGMMPAMIKDGCLPNSDRMAIMPLMAAGTQECLPVNFTSCVAASTQPEGHVNASPIVAADGSSRPDIVDEMDAMASMGMSKAPVKQPASVESQTLFRASYPQSGAHRVYWTVDAKKLNGSSRTAVSPAFEIMRGGPPVFKMMLSPKVAKQGRDGVATNQGRGGASFKSSKGKGIIQLKCEADIQSCGSSPVKFTIAVGKSREDIQKETPRGPVMHDFVARNGLCGLPQDEDTWDFGHFVDEASQTFVICLEVL